MKDILEIDPNRFIRVDDQLIRLHQVTRIAFGEIEQLRITVFYKDSESSTQENKMIVEGIPAIDLLMEVKASVLESKRLKWARHAYAIHNLIGHPLMQLLAFLRKYRWAMFIHDLTVPTPQGKHKHF